MESQACKLLGYEKYEDGEKSKVFFFTHVPNACVLTKISTKLPS
jgi:hypothetical protein